jgi:hypothetical protein
MARKKKSEREYYKRTFKIIPDSARTRRIKEKYGKDAFRKWGRKGSSPILKAWKEGRVSIKPRRKISD